MLTACGGSSRMGAWATGHSFECVDGVQYIQFTSGASVAYDTQGKVKTCEK